MLRTPNVYSALSNVGKLLPLPVIFPGPNPMPSTNPKFNIKFNLTQILTLNPDRNSNSNP